MLRTSAMHALFFGLKRAHQSTLRISRPTLTRMGLTAARFDLLYALRNRRRGMPQPALQRALGVTRATVSRMLQSLEELGLVRRTKDVRDRRRKLVELTASGRARIELAHEALVRSGWAQLAIDCALGGEGRAERWYRGSCFQAMGRLDDLLHAIRRAFYDTASLDYPWGEPSPSAMDD
jgi:DNA-binding MarR family transcriptional regulator